MQIGKYLSYDTHRYQRQNEMYDKSETTFES